MPTLLKIRQVAEICLVRKEQVNEAVRILGIPQSRVSEIKNSSALLPRGGQYPLQKG